MDAKILDEVNKQIREGEVFISTVMAGEETKVGWKTKRIGDLFMFGKMTMFPVFAQRDEIPDDILARLDAMNVSD